MSEYDFFLEIQNINAQLIEYNLTFTTKEIAYAKIDGLTDKTVKEEEEIKKENDMSKEIKLLGVIWYINNMNRAWFNYNDYIWKITTYTSGPGYTIFRQYKKFVIPKFRYYYTYLQLLNGKEAEKYMKWLRNKLRY